jgi:hypothetical protein
MEYRIPPLAAAAALFLSISRASAPKSPPSSPPAPSPSPALAQPAPAQAPKQGISPPDALKAQATDLRKKTFDYDLKSYLADERAKEAEAMRQAALGKSADKLFADPFAQALTEYQKRVAARDAGDYEEAIAGFQASTLSFSVLYRLCEASAASDKIGSRDFAKWDGSNWSLAEGRYGAAQSLLASDAKASSDAVDEANLRYGLVWQNALEFYAGERRSASEDEDKRALDLKANVAVKDEYAAARALYDEAEAKAAEKDFDTSAGLYDQAAKAFDGAYDDAKAKLDAALGELDSLDKALAAKGVRPAGAQ